MSLIKTALGEAFLFCLFNIIVSDFPVKNEFPNHIYIENLPGRYDLNKIETVIANIISDRTNSTH